MWRPTLWRAGCGAGAVFTAICNAMSSLGRRTYTNLWAPGWVLNSQDEILQGLEEKSQEPITMGSWPCSWRASQLVQAWRGTSGGIENHSRIAGRDDEVGRRRSGRRHRPPHLLVHDVC